MSRISCAQPRLSVPLLLGAALVSGCHQESDDTALVQQAIDRGGLVQFEARTYRLTRTIVVRRSNTIVQGVGPGTVFLFLATAPRKRCLNDRVFTMPCDFSSVLPRRIANSIAIGDDAFPAADDVSDLKSGDWLLITDDDSVIADAVTADWAQVDSVSATDRIVHLRMPFRTAFTNQRPWNPGHSGLGFRLITPVIENTEFRNFSISVSAAAAGAAAVGISVYGALNTTIDHVQVTSDSAQPLYSRFAKQLTITNSEATGGSVLSEFASTVDLTMRANRFSEGRAAGMGLDLGTAFFDVSNNDTPMSGNVGNYMLFGVHDGSYSDNRIAFVDSTTGSNSAAGILAWGVQNVTIAGNYLEGGAGGDSVGISVRAVNAEIEIPAARVRLSGNLFGSGWTHDYEPGTHPGP